MSGKKSKTLKKRKLKTPKRKCICSKYKMGRTTTKKYIGRGKLTKSDVTEAILKLGLYCKQNSLSIKEYKKLVLLLHPDKLVHLPNHIQESAIDAFKLLNNAWTDKNYTECAKLHYEQVPPPDLPHQPYTNSYKNDTYTSNKRTPHPPPSNLNTPRINPKTGRPYKLW